MCDEEVNSEFDQMSEREREKRSIIGTKIEWPLQVTLTDLYGIDQRFTSTSSKQLP